MYLKEFLKFENKNKMEEQFVPYELALKLKELGFDEKCFGWWSYINGTAASFYGYHCTNSELLELNSFNKNCTAPLWQQAFDWFRDIGYFVQIYPDDQQFINNAKQWFYVISKGTRTVNEKKFNTFEEAQTACVLRLIELKST